ncbi:MAG TPA: type II secretion system protein [Candidatus Saccharimonadales bacterium]
MKPTNHWPKKPHKQAGFTLVEVGIVVPMALLVLGVIFSYLITTYLEGLQQTTQLAVMDDANAAVNRMNDDLMVASGFQSRTSSYLNDVYAPSGGWNANTGTPTSPVLVVRALATTAPSKNAAKKVVRLQQRPCTIDNEIINPILYYNIIYFVSGGNLYKRTIASNTDSSGLTACDTPVQQKQTCPAGQSNAACNGTDILVASDVSDFHVTYGRPETSSDSCSNTWDLHVCEVSSPELASVATLELTITRTSAAEPFSFTTSTTFGPINL